MRPLIKWAGGKTRLLGDILPLVPSDASEIVEPFAGSAALSLHLTPERCLLNDMNGELVNLYQVVRDDVDGLADACMAHARLDGADHYRTVRAMDRDPDSPRWTRPCARPASTT